MSDSDAIPQLDETEMKPLQDLRHSHPHEFHTNVRDYVKRMIWDHVKKRVILRASIMGLPRSGKSEVGQTLSFWHVNAYNEALRQGYFEGLEIRYKDRTLMAVDAIDFRPEHVHDNQMVYKQYIQSAYRQKSLRFGQIHIIDESKRSVGGVGSMSDQIETRNINDITAKFGQSEIWITPTQIQARNATFGFYVKKKDMVNKVNWCLVYLPVQEPDGMLLYKFIGWIDVPLHNNGNFRDEYEKKKDGWIGDVLGGGGDPRDTMRGETARYFYELRPELFELYPNSGKPKTSRRKKIVALKQMMRQGEVQNFNEMEQEYIAEEAELMAEQEFNRSGEDDGGEDTGGT